MGNIIDGDNQTKSLKLYLGPLKNISPQEWIIFNYVYLLLSRNVYDNITHNRNMKKDILTLEPVISDNQPPSSTHINTSEADSCFSNFFLPTKLKLSQGQTFNMWKALMDLNFGFYDINRKKCICIMPLEIFPEFISNFQFNDLTFFELLQQFCSIFFMGLDIRILPNMDISILEPPLVSRFHSKTNQKQYFVGSLHAFLKDNIPKDAYCLLGITWTDLYPTEEQNFVLGEARSATRSGILSFGRHEPKLFTNTYSPPDLSNIDETIIWKMLKVITHETCHIFGFAHCVYFECLMNGSNSVVEAIEQPMLLCPICLRKLQRLCNFNIFDRYVNLLTFLQILNEDYPYDKFESAILWLRCVIKQMSDVPPN